MKTRLIELFTILMLFTFTLYNCREKDEDALLPSSTELTSQIDKLEMGKVTLEVPSELKVTPGKVAFTAKAEAVHAALKTITATDMVPANVSTAADDVFAALTTTQISALNELNGTGASLQALKSPEIRAILTKAAADSKLRMYLPKLDLTKIEADAKSATARVSKSSKGLKAAQEDECIDQANDKFDRTKAKLEASRSKELTKIGDSFTKDLEKIEKGFARCADENSPEKYNKMRQAGINIASQALSALEKARPYLKKGQYELLKALVYVQLLDYLGKVDQLEAERISSCTEQAEIAKIRAVSARDNNLSKVEAAYNEALEQAIEILELMIVNCHNQGSGK